MVLKRGSSCADGLEEGDIPCEGGFGNGVALVNWSWKGVAVVVDGPGRRNVC